MNSAQSHINEIQDYVIETGTYHPTLYDINGVTSLNKQSNASWNYTKWKNGRITIDGGISIFIDGNMKPSGNVYTSNYASRYGYPCKLVEAPHVIATVNYCSDSGSFWVGTRQWAESIINSTPNYCVMSSTPSDPNRNPEGGWHHICVHVEGRWK